MRAQSTFAGCTEYFAYVYGTYRSVSPLIYKCLLEYWRSFPGVRTRTTAELQDMAKRAKVGGCRLPCPPLFTITNASPA